MQSFPKTHVISCISIFQNSKTQNRLSVMASFLEAATQQRNYSQLSKQSPVCI